MLAGGPFEGKPCTVAVPDIARGTTLVRARGR